MKKVSLLPSLLFFFKKGGGVEGGTIEYDVPQKEKASTSRGSGGSEGGEGTMRVVLSGSLGYRGEAQGK